VTTPTGRQGRGRRFGRALLCGLLWAAGCYEGPGPKEPPPGSPGGLCAPGGYCDEPTSVCDPEGDFCYDKFNVCRGIFCGGNGLCNAVDGKPTCVCEPGYSNEMYSLYCESLSL
jgi:hypothetical protein